jgi:hypothetical protein
MLAMATCPQTTLIRLTYILRFTIKRKLYLVGTIGSLSIILAPKKPFSTLVSYIY